MNEYAGPSPKDKYGWFIKFCIKQVEHPRCERVLQVVPS